ncbi:AAA family ATPase [Salmonella enterica subsp. enterica serovar Glostrup]|nr:anticodon nuclease [Salmonella enterica]EDQ7105578.1 AAA family ATPase [Salmonella enterica subsp. enterica serovar Glostrup]EDV0467301.1 AAA family ATPase [Salmonella enterica subsp. enterica serovar Saintpaul]EAN8257681.1 anticodon nuclease [Salmonella enterica]EAT5020115.1 anticodon nuclease [Salmonella enterica]
MAKNLATFQEISEVAAYLREILDTKKYVLLFAYNGTGKTRLSMEFKKQGKNGDERDTLYFNAFTEDLFNWDNDLEADVSRELRLNTHSRFFDGLFALEMDNRIRPLLQSYADFDFKIKEKEIEITEGDTVYKQSITYVSFERETLVDGKTELVENIKISRGEENLFVWCFFLAIVQLVLDKEEGSPYAWVQYIYIDDPISSLDDNNAIQVANHLAQLLKLSNNGIKTVISSHHALFFNVICNELKSGLRYMLCSHEGRVKYSLKDTSDTPFFHHVASLKRLAKAAKRNELYTYHFSILRNILERSASFHGFNGLSDFVKRDKDDPDGVLHHRIIQLLNHGGYSHFEPQEMIEENKRHFKNILNNFMKDYGFNPELFPEEQEETTE